MVLLAGAKHVLVHEQEPRQLLLVIEQVPWVLIARHPLLAIQKVDAGAGCVRWIVQLRVSRDIRIKHPLFQRLEQLR